MERENYLEDLKKEIKLEPLLRKIITCSFSSVAPII